MVYLDDINVLIKSFKDHLKHLSQRLRDAKLKLKVKKCSLCREFAILEHVVSSKGIAADPAN